MFSCIVYRRAAQLRSYLGFSLSYPISSQIFQNAYCSKVIGDSPVKNKQENAEQVSTLLRDYGLSETQISRVSKMLPKIFQFHPENVVLPKLKFLSSIVGSSDNLQKLILSNPWLLQRSLENQLIPTYNYLKSLPLANNHIAIILRRNSRILGTNLEKIVSNVDALRQIGVTQYSISQMMVHNPSLVQLNSDKLKRSIDEAISLGFDPLSTMLVQAVAVLCGSSKETLENKAKLYRSYGLSDTEVQLAFRSHPLCMRLSEEKISRGMDLFVNEMGWSPAIVARWPSALFYCFEKRIVPRCRVIKVLMEKGLVKEYQTLMSFFGTTEKQFLDKFVCKYEDVLPELKNLYLA